MRFRVLGFWGLGSRVIMAIQFYILEEISNCNHGNL